MKNKILQAGIALIACLFIQNTVVAQTLVSPTLTDILWVPGGVSGINTALIDIIDSER